MKFDKIRNLKEVHEHFCKFCGKKFTNRKKQSDFCSPSHRNRHTYRVQKHIDENKRIFAKTPP